MRHLIDLTKRVIALHSAMTKAISRQITRFLDGPYADEIVRPKA
ncbi:MAG TPA: hypothetical protein VIR33_03500 [Thermopolyspora sp.]